MQTIDKNRLKKNNNNKTKHDCLHQKSALERLKEAEYTAQTLRGLFAFPGPRFNCQHPHQKHVACVMWCLQSQFVVLQIWAGRDW